MGIWYSKLRFILVEQTGPQILQEGVYIWRDYLLWLLSFSARGGAACAPFHQFVQWHRNIVLFSVPFLISSMCLLHCHHKLGKHFYQSLHQHPKNSLLSCFKQLRPHFWWWRSRNNRCSTVGETIGKEYKSLLILSHVMKKSKLPGKEVGSGRSMTFTWCDNLMLFWCCELRSGLWFSAFCKHLRKKELWQDSTEKTACAKCLSGSELWNCNLSIHMGNSQLDCFRYFKWTCNFLILAWKIYTYAALRHLPNKP